MKHFYKEGDTKQYSIIVSEKDTARFPSGEVHPVYSTFALARDAEWCGRQFVLDMKEEDEEGIGTKLSIDHISPASIEQKVVFTSTITEVRKNTIKCSYLAKVKDKIIAKGMQEQKVLKKEKIRELFSSLSGN